MCFFYVDSRACVRLGNDVSEWFPLNVGLRQGCVMSPWLFNVCMDGVVRKVNVRVLGKGLELLSANGGRFEINQLLFADDTALVTDSGEKLSRLVSEFGRVCERRKLRVNLGKSEVMRCSRYGNGDRMHVVLNGEPLEEVDCFKYLGSQVAADGGCERDVVERMNEGCRAWGVLKSVLSNRVLGIKAKKCLYEGVVAPTALYGAEAWVMRSAERRKVNVLEMKYLRSLVVVSRMDRVGNEEVRRRAGIERELSSRADQRVLRWFWYVERMDEYHMARRLLMAEVSGGRVRGRPRLGWMHSVKVALGNRGMTVEAAQQCAKDRKEWRALVHM